MNDKIFIINYKNLQLLLIVKRICHLLFYVKISVFYGRRINYYNIVEVDSLHFTKKHTNKKRRCIDDVNTLYELYIEIYI